jgi:rhodanese-related sulfurtransferase
MASQFRILLSLTLLPMVLAACRPRPQEQPVAPRGLSMDEVATLLAHQALFIVDVNGPARYAKGHLPGAVWAAFDDVKAVDLPARKDQLLLFYCANELCSASHEAARQAIALGYTRVFIMPAGIYGWERAGRPLERDH